MEVSEFKYVSVAAGTTETLFNASINPATADPEVQIYSSTLERVLICNTDNEDIAITLTITDGTDSFNILQGCVIPTSTTLDVLNGVPFIYDARYRINITTAAGHTCDVLASKK
jgi:hypothetical protein